MVDRHRPKYRHACYECSCPITLRPCEPSRGSWMRTNFDEDETCCGTRWSIIEHAWPLQVMEPLERSAVSMLRVLAVSALPHLIGRARTA